MFVKQFCIEKDLIYNYLETIPLRCGEVEFQITGFYAGICITRIR